MVKWWNHFKTITAHRTLVCKYCFRVGLYRQGLLHDLSKYSPVEFRVGAKYFCGTRSPNELERLETGVSTAWLHHKGRNRHHFEYWTDYDPKTKQVKPVKMPLRFVAEMFCDRVAAGKTYKGKDYTNQSPLEYFYRGKPTRTIHPETSALLEKLLKMLAEKGEEETFRYIRGLLKRGKEY